MFDFNGDNEIESVEIKDYPLTFLQKVKRHYKNYAKIYNISFGLLALVMVVFHFVKPKKSKNVKKWKKSLYS